MLTRTGSGATCSTRDAPLAERMLRRLGADPRFVEDVLGDLAEEYASRREGGAPLARLWYVREAVRATPHLLASALRRTSRRERIWLAAFVTLGALTLLATLLTLRARSATSIEAASATGFVVNGMRPVQLPVRVRDAAGRTRKPTGVQYRWVSGAALGVAPSGVATCAQPGDAVVRASLGALSTDLLVRCRPVFDVHGPAMLDLVVGDSARDVPFEAVGLDGRLVTLLAGRFTVRDSTVATLEGPRIRARSAGTTWVQARFGERASFTSVHVYEPVASPENVRAGQHVAVRLRMAAGEIRGFSLPAGSYFLAILPPSAGEQRPRLAVSDASCRSTIGHLECTSRRRVTVFAFHPRDAAYADTLSGTLVVWRQDDP